DFQHLDHSQPEMQNVDVQEPNFLFSFTVAIKGVYHNGYAAIPDRWVLLQSTSLTARIKSQMLAHVVQTDIPMAVVGHVNLNRRAIELKWKAIGDFCHDVLLVLSVEKIEGHMTFYLLPYFQDRKTYVFLSFSLILEQ
ncbi:MAG: hypothetical protein MN733_21445, partial [Nitrososphaera sp.]|nr:hypothetical protein [Nitrososphaera sp.]